MLRRLHDDFPLAMVTYFGLITVLGVLPFALFRFANGDMLMVALDTLILACIAGGVVYAWVTGRTGGANLFMALVYSVSCVGVAHVGGLPGLLWVYPVIMANFLLIGRRVALLFSLIAIAGVAASDLVLASLASQLVFVVTALVTSLFAQVFASRSDKQRQQLQAIAAHDPLTGAYNRRGMEPELDIAIASSERFELPLGLLVFDLDHFKRVNDTWGHETGDAVLVEIARVVKACTRKGDRFVRLGGEEFGVLIPGAGDPSLQQVAEKLRAAVQEEVQCHGDPITISIGATWHVPGESAAEFLARADEAMYAAKREGRNRVVVNGSPPAAPGEATGPAPGTPTGRDAIDGPPQPQRILR